VILATARILRELRHRSTMPEGFAMEEYFPPTGDHVPHVLGGTMPKDSNENSSGFAMIEKNAGKVPGPGHYDTMARDQKDWNNKGTTFCKMSRDAIARRARAGPAVGQYQVTAAAVLTSPRPTGGQISKSPKGCLIYDRAVRASKGMPDPGKYDALEVQLHKATISFHSPKTTPRLDNKKAVPGPGLYSPHYALTEKHGPSYSSRKEEVKSSVDDKKDKVPAPGTWGIPDAKHVDRLGATKHTQVLLRDRSERQLH